MGHRRRRRCHSGVSGTAWGHRGVVRGPPGPRRDRDSRSPRGRSSPRWSREGAHGASGIDEIASELERRPADGADRRMDGDRFGRVVQDGAVLDLLRATRRWIFRRSTPNQRWNESIRACSKSLLATCTLLMCRNASMSPPAQVDVERITGVGHEEQRSGLGVGRRRYYRRDAQFTAPNAPTPWSRCWPRRWAPRCPTQWPPRS